MSLIPDIVTGIFHWHNPSGCTMALGLTRSLTEMSKAKWSRYWPSVAQRVGTGVALLFHDHGTRREWVVSSTPRPHFTPEERTGTHFTGGWVGPRAGLEGRQSLYRLSYSVHFFKYYTKLILRLLRHVSVFLHHLQWAYQLCQLKLLIIKVIKYSTSVHRSGKIVRKMWPHT
jgi:hypothetical protein